MQERIAGVELVEFHAAHLSNMQAGGAFSLRVLAFLTAWREELPMDEEERYETGMQVRRALLGDAHVDHSLPHLTPFNEAFQEMITRHAWGDI